MLEVLEIIVGALLFLIYLVVTLIMPLAAFGVALYALALMMGALLRLLSAAWRVFFPPPRATVEDAPSASRRRARSWAPRVWGLVPWVIALGSVWLFFRVAIPSQGSTPTGDTDSSLVGFLLHGARALVWVFSELQERSIAFWTGHTLAAFVTASEDKGLHALSFFFQLGARRLYDSLEPTVSFLQFRWLVSSFLASILAAGAFMGWPRMGKE